MDTGGGRCSGVGHARRRLVAGGVARAAASCRTNDGCGGQGAAGTPPAYLWRPVDRCVLDPVAAPPLTLAMPIRLVALTVGGLLYWTGLALYLWGAKTLGGMYKPASGFGVQLNVDHRLVTHGPFAFVRHPLYLGLQVAAVGGLLVYRMWTLVFVTANFLGLFFRARREEQALAAEFGERWERYCREVPAWIPRLRRQARVRRRTRR